MLVDQTINPTARWHLTSTVVTNAEYYRKITTILQAWLHGGGLGASAPQILLAIDVEKANVLKIIVLTSQPPTFHPFPTFYRACFGSLLQIYDRSNFFFSFMEFSTLMVAFAYLVLFPEGNQAKVTMITRYIVSLEV